MATRRMLQDTATVFIPKGEDFGGKMQYEVYLFDHVFCRASTGAAKSGDGYAPSESITLYAFDRDSKVTAGGAELDIAATCEAIFKVIRDGYNPKADNGEQPYVVPYDATTETSPPAKSRRITSVTRRKAGTPRMWHWEVHAV